MLARFRVSQDLLAIYAEMDEEDTAAPFLSSPAAEGAGVRSGVGLAGAGSSKDSVTFRLGEPAPHSVTFADLKCIVATGLAYGTVVAKRFGRVFFLAP